MAVRLTAKKQIRQKIPYQGGGMAGHAHFPSSSINRFFEIQKNATGYFHHYLPNLPSPTFISLKDREI